MADLITELTQEQEELLGVVRDEWLQVGRATESEIRRDVAREAVVKAYTCAGVEPPEPEFMHFGRSPMEGAVIVAVCKDLWENQNKTVPTWARVKPLVDEYIQMRCNDQPLPDHIKELAQNSFQWVCYGQHDAGWIAYYDYFQRIGVEGLEPLEGLKEVCRYCGWWWPMSKIAVITEKPTLLGLDNDGHLHNESTRSIQYSDEWGLYTWHGLNVPGRLITHPSSITSAEIMHEQNTEIRRVMIERMGEDKFLSQANAQLVDADTDAMGLPRKLWRVDFGDNEPWQAVEVTNSTPESDGTRRKYLIPVVHTVRTAGEAVASTFLMGTEEYNPGQQT